MHFELGTHLLPSALINLSLMHLELAAYQLPSSISALYLMNVVGREQVQHWPQHAGDKQLMRSSSHHGLGRIILVHQAVDHSLTKLMQHLHISFCIRHCGSDALDIRDATRVGRGREESRDAERRVSLYMVLQTAMLGTLRQMTKP